jgi:hypothetical protein
VTNSSYSVRRATALDYSQLEMLAYRAEADSDMRPSTPDENKLRQHLIDTLKQPERYYCGVLVAPYDAICGIQHIITYDMLYSKEQVVSTTLLYIDHSHRSYRNVAMLLRAGEAWARDHNVPVLEFSIDSTSRPDRTAALHKRLGYRVTGTIMSKELI